MASKRNKKDKATAPMTYKAVHWALFLLVLLNLFLVFRFERDRKPVVVHETVTTVSNHVYRLEVTNYIDCIESEEIFIGPTNELGGVKVNDAAFEIPLSYHMYQSGTRYFIQIGSFQFGVGDMTSYGRIKSIFPERVLLDNGYSIKNQEFEQRFGFNEQSRRLRREYLSDLVSSNSSHFVPAHLFPGETVLPSNRRFYND